MANPRFSNGDKAKDRVTGLTGIITATTVWLNGCIRYVLQPQEIKDGGPVESSWFDENDLEVIESAAVQATPVRKTGGPQRGESGVSR